jgi:hypothetical protein
LHWVNDIGAYAASLGFMAKVCIDLLGWFISGVFVIVNCFLLFGGGGLLDFKVAFLAGRVWLGIG